jgi:hypothetical protein
MRFRFYQILSEDNKKGCSFETAFFNYSQASELTYYFNLPGGP